MAPSSSFAESQLSRYGWKKGQGLGKSNSGISEAIKVKRKNDTDGLGKEGDQFDFAWWDHVYNRAASNIIVAKDDDDVVVCKPQQTLKREDIITTKRPSAEPKPAPTKTAATSSPLYQHFVSSSSLVAVDPAEAKDYSMKLSDEQLISICEGRRFGHRGGYAQSGKEKRLEKQDSLLQPKVQNNPTSTQQKEENEGNLNGPLRKHAHEQEPDREILEQDSSSSNGSSGSAIQKKKKKRRNTDV